MPHGDPAAARRRLHAIGAAHLEFARKEPGLFATAFALPQPHAYSAAQDDTGRLPLAQLRRALDELVDAGVLAQRRREGIEYPIWSAVHGMATLAGEGPCATRPKRCDATSRNAHSPSSTKVWRESQRPLPGDRDGRDRLLRRVCRLARGYYVAMARHGSTPASVIPAGAPRPVRPGTRHHERYAPHARTAPRRTCHARGSQH